MAIEYIGKEAAFGISTAAGTIYPQTIEKKQKWQVKTWTGANGERGGGVRWQPEVELTMTCYAQAAPDESALLAVFSALGVKGTVVITEISESRKAEDFTEWSISATAYPDMASESSE